MTDMLPLLRIFISSPGDVQDERKIAMNVIREDLAAIFLDRAVLRVVAWDDPVSRVPMPVTLTPQTAIDKGMKRPSECDIVVVMLWARFGQELDVEEHGLKDGVRPYWSGTEWEYEDAIKRSKETGRPRVFVYRRIGVKIDLDDKDRAEKTKQYERVESFFADFREKNTGAWLASYSQYKKPAEFRKLLAHDLRIIVEELLTTSETVSNNTESQLNELPGDVMAAPEWKSSPFPGLRAFTNVDAPIFFGRSRETDELLERLHEKRFVAVVGASGSGKSSLVWAGLIPRLEANAIAEEATGSKDWLSIRFTPAGTGNNPFVALAVKLEPFLESRGWNALQIAEHLCANPDQLGQICEDVLVNRDPWSELLFFIDQFEELMTLISESYRLPFAQMLLNAVQNCNRIRIVITLRADFYHNAISLHPLTKLLQDGSFPLSAPDSIALSEMIHGPAQRAGLKFEGNLAHDILTDTGDEPGALALLAYALDELYKRRHDGKLTIEAYKDLGRVQGAIAKRAELAFSLLAPNIQAALPKVFHALVTVNDKGIPTRRRVPYDHVAHTKENSELIDALTTRETRLLLRDKENGLPVVEVAHEALLLTWPRLADWIKLRQDDLLLLGQLRLAVQDWQHSKYSIAYRWHDDRLYQVHQMLDRLQLDLQKDLIPDEQAFIRTEFDLLLDELEKETVTHSRRNLVGERLNLLNDKRVGVGLLPDGTPDVVWCHVNHEDLMTTSIEGVSIQVDPFYIAKYPITYKQFGAFLEAVDGYGNDAWWKGLSARTTRPESQTFKFDNHPRETVTWYEAMAFCRWLSSRLQYRVTLPTEGQWQVAASQTWRYPWGNDWNVTITNTRENDLRKTVAVGMYPSNAAVCGALDLSGNVWEWLLTDYETASDDQSLNCERVLRGGSWSDSRSSARVFVRLWRDQDYRSSTVGFRVCCVTPKS